MMNLLPVSVTDRCDLPTSCSQPAASLKMASSF